MGCILSNNTFFSWELDKFIEFEKDKLLNSKHKPLSRNEVVFHDAIDLEKYACKYIQLNSNQTKKNKKTPLVGNYVKLPNKEYSKCEPNMKLLPCYLYPDISQTNIDFLNVMLKMMNYHEIKNDINKNVNYIEFSIVQFIRAQMLSYFYVHRTEINNDPLYEYVNNRKRIFINNNSDNNSNNELIISKP